MDCPRCHATAFPADNYALFEAIKTIPQWRCLPCGWRDDYDRDQVTLNDREHQRTVVRGWVAKHEAEHSHLNYIGRTYGREAREFMARGPLSEEGRLGLVNGGRRRRGLPPLTLEQYRTEINGHGHTNGNGIRYSDLAPLTDNLEKPVDEFIPGQFQPAHGAMALLPMEVKFSIGRTVEEWSQFLALWKSHYPNFRLDHAQAFEESGSQLRVALSAIPKGH